MNSSELVWSRICGLNHLIVKWMPLQAVHSSALVFTLSSGLCPHPAISRGEKPEARSMPFLCGKKLKLTAVRNYHQCKPYQELPLQSWSIKNFNHISNRKTALLTYKASWWALKVCLISPVNGSNNLHDKSRMIGPGATATYTQIQGERPDPIWRIPSHSSKTRSFRWSKTRKKCMTKSNCWIYPFLILALIAVLVGLSSSVFPILRSSSDFQSLQILPTWICIPGTRNHNCQSPQQLAEPTIAIHRDS